MRSAGQISRSPREWKDAQALEREQALRAFLAMTRAARRNGEPWVEWIDAGCPDVTTPEGARFASPRGAARRSAPAGALL